MNRRTLLASTLLIPVTGCAALQSVTSTLGLTVPTNVQQGAADIVIGAGIISTVVGYMTSGGVAVPAAVQTALATVQTNAQAVAADASAATGTVASQFMSAGRDVITELAPIAAKAAGKWGPLVTVGLGALNTLLGVIQAELSVPVPAAASSGVGVALPTVSIDAVRNGTWQKPLGM